ncbi:hypothetical protein NDU88_003974 [Pleurodeles waltl]|uniref:Uncharacterized protein n=1 Tax=Pleurodeles waltl TaxID=8319 RepID=A0AAV7T720_PLEWA|nr:hypothetical protein NDU88_003974 [Pleurodeles waltl]
MEDTVWTRRQTLKDTEAEIMFPLTSIKQLMPWMVNKQALAVTNAKTDSGDAKFTPALTVVEQISGFMAVVVYVTDDNGLLDETVMMVDIVVVVDNIVDGIVAVDLR